jgi:hypothetical protein
MPPDSAHTEPNGVYEALQVTACVDPVPRCGVPCASSDRYVTVPLAGAI